MRVSKQISRSVTVLGAGIQGCCTALELSSRGYEVTLLERDALAMNRASLRNEGKIHLGLVYANEASMETARLQLEGALSFRHLLEKWVGNSANMLGNSTTFDYLVAVDSLLSSAELEDHYMALQLHYLERLREEPGLDYLGSQPAQLYRKISENKLQSRYNPERVCAGYATAELAISTDILASVLRKAISNEPLICFRGDRTVKHVERGTNGFLVEGWSAQGIWQENSDQVVNAAWDGRPAIDHSMGIGDQEGLLHRLKYRVIAQTPRELLGAHSATIVLGPYGDIVIRPDGSAYLSWYPLALNGWSHDLLPPQDWMAACQGIVSTDDFERMAKGFCSALDDWMPGMGKARAVQVDAGVIMAFGKSDVDDKASELHNRTRVGVTSSDGYHSLDAGKLTTAPLFAMQCADQVCRQ